MGVLTVLIVDPPTREDLERALVSTKGAASQIIVVSSNEELCIPGIEFVKIDNSKRKALNNALDNAKNDWILWLEGKEVIFKHHLLALKRFLEKGDDATAFALLVRKYSNEHGRIGWVPSSDVPGFTGFLRSNEIRICKNDARILFSDSIKPTILDSLGQFKSLVKDIKDIPVHNYDGPNQVSRLELEKLAEDNPDDIEVQYRLGLAYLNSGNFSKAKMCFVKVANRDDKYEFVLTNLGVTMLKLGHADEALQLFSQSLQINSQDVSALNNMASILRSQKKFEEAEKLFKKALQISPRDPRIFRGLALTYLDQGKKEDASRLIKDGINLHNNSPILKDVIEQL